MKNKFGWSVVLKGKNRGKVYKRDCPETTGHAVFDTRKEANLWALYQDSEFDRVMREADEAWAKRQGSRIKVK